MKFSPLDTLRRYQEVANIGQEINHELSTVDILFQKLQTHAASVLDTSDTFLLAIYQPQTNNIDVYLEDGGHAICRENDLLAGACKHVIETKETLLVRQMSEEAEYLPFRRVEINTGSGSKESLLFVPLVFRDVPLGVLSVQHKQPNIYDQEDLSILQLLANHIALALHNMRLYDNLSRLNETGQLLTQQLATNQVLQATVEKIQDATKADSVVLHPYESTTERFIHPPSIAGTLHSSSPESLYPSQPDDIARLMLRHIGPIFARDSATVYTKLHGDPRIRQGNFQEREGICSTASVSLLVRDMVVGVLFINFRQVQRFDASQKLLIEGLGHYAAIAIKNAQEYDILIRRRVRELEILQDIDRELARNLDLNSVLNTMLRLAREHVPAEECAIILLDAQTQTLVMPAAFGPNAEVRRDSMTSLQETGGITHWVLEHKQPARVDNVHDLPWRDIYFSATSDTISELDVPLLDGQEIVGVLNFESTREGAFRQEDQDFLLTLAGQGVLAIKNAQAYEREKHLAAEAQVLYRISKEIISQLDLNHVFDLILENALDLTQCITGNLMLYDAEHNDLWMGAERGVVEEKKNQRQALDQGVIGYVATHKEPLMVDLSEAPWNEINTGFFPGANSELAVPMLAGNNDLRGVLNVESSIPHGFSEGDKRLLQGLADLAVIALQNAQAHNREKRLVEETQSIYQISREISSQLNSDYLFNLILEKALEWTGAPTGTLEIYDPEWNDLRMVADRGAIEHEKHQRLSLDQGVVGYVALHKQLLNVDPSQSPWKEVYVASILGTHSELAVPMLAGNELRGILNVESPSPNHFTASDERSLQTLAQLAVVALQHTERYDKAEDAAKRFALLSQAGQELGKITEFSQLEQAYNTILNITEEYCNGRVIISRYEDDTRELDVIYTSHHQERLPYLNGKLNMQAIRGERTIVVYNIDIPPEHVVLAKTATISFRSLIATSITFKERYYGSLEIDHEEMGHFGNGDVQFLQGLAQQLASTIYRLETVKARQEFEQISSIGHATFELTHRLANDLALVQFYTSDIQWQMKKLGITDDLVSEKLDEIVLSVQGVLNFSNKLKQTLVTPGEDEPILMSPQELFKDSIIAHMLPDTIQVILHIDPGVQPVRAVRSQVVDILRNFVANAIDAMPEGGEITLQARNNGHFVALEVIDTGTGIPPQHLSKIFELAFSTKGSSGFGLWSARRNALRNKGGLRVESNPGSTTLTLLLPRTDGGII